MKKTNLFTLLLAVLLTLSYNAFAVDHGSMSVKNVPIYPQYYPNEPEDAIAGVTMEFKVVTIGTTTWAWTDLDGANIGGAGYSSQLRWWHPGKVENNLTERVAGTQQTYGQANSLPNTNPVTITFFQDADGFNESAAYEYNYTLQNSPVEGDNTAPTLTASVSDIEDNAVVLSLSATDANDYFFYITDGEGTNYVSFLNTITISNLISGTDYSFKVQAIDFSGNESAEVVLDFQTTGELPPFDTDQNLALGKPAFASSGADPATNSNDGNMGTRWGSNAGENNAWWYTNLGAEYVVNQVKISWEGAYSKEFLIQVALDLPGTIAGEEGWTTVAHITDYNPNTQEGLKPNFQVIDFEATPAKFVKFQGIEIGNWGNSFWEFEVYGTGFYNPDGSDELTSVVLTPNNQYIYAGEEFQFTGYALNGKRERMDDVDLVWSVDPATATISQTGLFTSNTAGSYTVTLTATEGAIEVSQSVNIRVYKVSDTGNLLEGRDLILGNVYFAPGHNPNNNYTASVEGDEVSITMDDATWELWMAQFPISVIPPLAITPGEAYKMSVNVNSNNTTPMYVKMLLNNDVFIEMGTAGTPLSVQPGDNYFENTMVAPAALTSIPEILFAFGGNPANTELVITGISIEKAELSGVDKVEVTPASKTLLIGEEFQFTAKALDAAGQEVDDAIITWSVSPTTATVVNGLFTTETAGNYIVTASVQNGPNTINGSAMVKVLAEPLICNNLFDETELSVGEVYFAPNHNVSTNYDASVLENNEITIRLGDATWDTWQAQFPFHPATPIAMTPGEKYLLAVDVEVTGSIDFYMKILDDNDNVFMEIPSQVVTTGSVSLELEDVVCPEGLSQISKVLFDFAPSAANTDVAITNLRLCIPTEPLPGVDPEENQALNKPTQASSGTAGNANDANLNSRWESASSDPQWWFVDLGQDYALREIKIMWEGAYSKDFDIEASSEYLDPASKAGWRTIAEVRGYNAVEAGELKPNYQTIDVSRAHGRYLRFYGTARGTGYGHSFWEFEVYADDYFDPATANVLDYVVISPTEASVKTGVDYQFAGAAYGPYGDEIEDAELIWSVLPETATISDTGLFSAEEAGVYTVTLTAKQDGASISESATITVTEPIDDGDNLLDGHSLAFGEVYFAPNWVASDNYTTGIEDDVIGITMGDFTWELWMAQFPLLITPPVPITPTDAYKVTIDVKSDKDTPMYVKVLQGDNEYLEIGSSSAPVSVKAGDNHFENVMIPVGNMTEANTILLAFGGNPADTNLEITGLGIYKVMTEGIDRVVVTPETKTILVGEELQLTAQAQDIAGQEVEGVEFEWSVSSSKASVVDGLFKAEGPGIYVVTATAEDGPKVVSGTATITVLTEPIECNNLLDDATLALTTVYYYPGWNASENYDAVVDENNDITIRLGDATYERWQAQFTFSPDNAIVMNPGKKYNLSADIATSANLPFYLKFMDDNDNVFIEIPLQTVDAPGKLVEADNVTCPDGLTQVTRILFDFGGNAANTEIEINDLTLCMVEGDDPGEVHGSMVERGVALYPIRDGAPAGTPVEGTMDFKLVSVGGKTYAWTNLNGLNIAGNSWSSQLRYWPGKLENNLLGRLAGTQQTYGSASNPTDNPALITFLQEDNNTFFETGDFYFSTTMLNSQDVNDTEAPVLAEPTVVSQTATALSLSLSATDNSGDYYYYIADAASGFEFVSFINDITLELVPEKNYTFTIVAVDFSGNKSEEREVKVIAEEVVNIVEGIAQALSFKLDSRTNDQLVIAVETVNEADLIGDAFITISIDGVLLKETTGAVKEWKPTIGASGDNKYRLTIPKADIPGWTNGLYLGLNFGYILMPIGDWGHYVLENTVITAGANTGKGIYHAIGTGVDTGNSIQKVNQADMYIAQTSDMVSVYSQNAISNIRVYSVGGQLVDMVQNHNQVNTSGLSKGVYLLQATDAQNNQKTFKLSVK